jgi:hypothetical protein
MELGCRVDRLLIGIYQEEMVLFKIAAYEPENLEWSRGLMSFYQVDSMRWICYDEHVKGL